LDCNNKPVVSLSLQTRWSCLDNSTTTLIFEPFLPINPFLLLSLTSYNHRLVVRA